MKDSTGEDAEIPDTLATHLGASEGPAQALARNSKSQDTALTSCVQPLEG